MAVRRSRTTTSVPNHGSSAPSTPTGRSPRQSGAASAATAAATTTAPVDSPRSFAELGLPVELVDGLAELGITEPFPIQAATLPDSLAGRDVLGRGRTGSGKTYAFALPVLARLAAQPRRAEPGRPRALILAPTRELATQIEATLAPLAKALSLRTLTVFGGVRPGPQLAGLRAGVDVLVACPGRLADHLSTGGLRLDSVAITVLDEADHMADLGFLPVVRRLLDQTPKNGQRLLFSATLDAGVDVLVRRYLSNPVTHSVDSARSPVAAMEHHVLHVRPESRLPVLVDLASAPGRTLVFTRTKHGAKKLARQLVSSGVAAVELHGNLAQNARTRSLAAFSQGSANTLVATDIAARGIHVDDVALVIHADPPVEHKAYLHRSGRTARAGAAGTVVTLMTDDQVEDVRALTRKAGIRPTTTRLDAGDPLLARIAPGDRTLSPPPATPAPGSAAPNQPGRGGRRAGKRPSAQRAATSRRQDGAAHSRENGQPAGSANPARNQRPPRPEHAAARGNPGARGSAGASAERDQSATPGRSAGRNRSTRSNPARTAQPARSGRPNTPHRGARSTAR